MAEDQSPFLYLVPKAREQNTFLSRTFSLENICQFQGIVSPSKVTLSHGRRGLVDYSPWSREELDTTEQLHFHFSLSCIGEGNGNPLQCPCLGNPRDAGVWWAAIYGVAQSRT